MSSFRSRGLNDAHGRIFIALGANRPYRRATPLENLNSALGALIHSDIALIATSRPWRSPAWPNASDPSFVNGCAELQTDLSPERLLSRLHEVEHAFGRTRTFQNAPRSLDLDLIDYRGWVRTGNNDDDLILPHPRARHRAFVLMPLKEIAPDWRDPESGEGIDRLIAELPLSDRQLCRPEGGVLHAAVGGLKPLAE